MHVGADERDHVRDGGVRVHAGFDLITHHGFVAGPVAWCVEIEMDDAAGQN